jgi:hypothetical protein
MIFKVMPVAGAGAFWGGSEGVSLSDEHPRKTRTIMLAMTRTMLAFIMNPPANEKQPDPPQSSPPVDWDREPKLIVIHLVSFICLKSVGFIEFLTNF